MSNNKAMRNELQKNGTASLRTIELRRQIAMQVDPLKKIMRVANGMRVRGMKRRPTEDEIIDANYKLLDKFLPDLKAMELSENPDAPLGAGKADLVAALMKRLGEDDSVPKNKRKLKE